MSSILPDGFEALEPLVADWALATENARWSKRRQSSKDEIEMLYAAVFPQVDRILEECDRHAVGELPESHQRLYALALMCAEIAPHAELYKGSAKVPHSFEEGRFICWHGDRETWRCDP